MPGQARVNASMRRLETMLSAALTNPETHVAVTTTVCASFFHLHSFCQFGPVNVPVDLKHCAIYGLPFIT